MIKVTMLNIDKQKILEQCETDQQPPDYVEGFLINWCLALTTEQESEGEEKQKVLIALFFFLTLSINIDCFQDCLLALLLRRISPQNLKIVVSY